MPELPDVELYLHVLRPRIVGRTLTGLRIASPFVLRTFEPDIETLIDKDVKSITRMGKRFVFEFEDDLYLVIHLMIAGRFRWSEKAKVKPAAKVGLASFYFGVHSLLLVEASPKKRAGIWVVRGRENVVAMDPGGLDVMGCSLAEFAERLRSGNHTLKRILTMPRMFDGIGNAFSDEILHAAKLSPVKLTSRMTDEEVARLFEATRTVLQQWTQLLKARFSSTFPGSGDVTAFRPEFAVHGKFGQPCPVCGTSVQRIRHAENETNYCPRCQTEGKMLADRSLSRLLKDDWPSTIEEWEKE